MTTKTKKATKRQTNEDVGNVAQQATPTKPEPLFTDEQVKRLDDLTDEIKTAQQSFVTIADDVLVIDDEGLWAARKHPERDNRYKSMAEYCEVNFQFSGSDTSRYANAGRVLKVLRTNGVSELPRNESQTRALWRVFKSAQNAEKDTDKKQRAGEKKLVQFWAKVTGEGHTTADRIEAAAGIAKPKGSKLLKKFDGKALAAQVIVGSTQEANAIAKQFAPHNRGPKPQQSGYAVEIGFDKVSELGEVLDVFDNSKSKEITVRVVR